MNKDQGVNAKLVKYEYVPPGFEMLIEKKEVKAWNLWWNIKLTDDPDAWDSEIKAINRMQDRLSELTVDQRLIRAQMAEFCRMHPPFPRSIDMLCEEIGSGHFSNPIKMGCEGRSLLNCLGCHDAQSLNNQRRETFAEYARALEKWLSQRCPESPIESKVFGFLAQPTKSKKAFAEKLVSLINSEALTVSSLKELSRNECVKINDKFETLGFRPFNCFRCDESTPPIPNCQCCYSMFIDASLLCIGTFDEKRSISDEFRCFVEENILAYSLAINSWLKEAPPTHITSPINPRYITKDNALAIAEKIHSFLGEKDEAKEWLTACLLKTIKDNQRWHKKTELIDNFPEATSWFKEML